MPCVTVVIPVYNAVPHLGKCLSALRRQSLKDIEILFVDDCSTDDTARQIEAAIKEDQRIRLIRHAKNLGPGAARNNGIDAAAGDFITFLDCDDRYGSDFYLQGLYEAARNSGLQVAAARFCNERGFGRVEDDFPQDDIFWGYSLLQSGPVEYSDFQFDYGFHRFMFARVLFENGQNRFPDLRFYEDPVFLVRILHDAGTFHACSDQRYMYRCEFRKEHWSTSKALDLLKGVRRNLKFAQTHGYGRLFWATVKHLECETSRLSIGFNPNLDLRAIEVALCQVEGLVYDNPFNSELAKETLLMRSELNKALLCEDGPSAKAKLHHAFASSSLWYHVRPFVKK